MSPLLFMLEGFLCMIVSLPMIRRQVRPNRWYGFRTPKTLRSPAIWYPANEFCGRSLFAAGILILLTGLVMLPISWIPVIGQGLAFCICLTVTLISLLWSVIRSFRYLSRL